MIHFMFNKIINLVFIIKLVTVIASKWGTLLTVLFVCCCPIL